MCNSQGGGVANYTGQKLILGNLTYYFGTDFGTDFEKFNGYSFMFEGGGSGGEAHLNLGVWGLFSIPSPDGKLDILGHITYYSLIGSNSATDKSVNPL